MTREAEALQRYVTEALAAEEPSGRVKPLKGMLWLVWRGLPVSEREAFYQMVMPDNGYRLWEPRPLWPNLKDPVLEKAAWHWSAISRWVTRRADVEFAEDVDSRIARRRDKFWTPSQKQRDWMKRLYREWLAGQVAERIAAE